MLIIEDVFVEYLRRRRPASVYLKPYWGNSGDVLIWMGLEFLLAELGIAKTVNPKQADVVLWPGGNPTMWEKNIAGWVDCWTSYPATEFVVAPATFRGDSFQWRQALKETPANIKGIFARDPESHHTIQALALPPKITIGLGHDPAFHLRSSPWARAHCEAASSEYVLASFRGDHESALKPIKSKLLPNIPPFSSVTFRINARRARRFLDMRLSQVRANSQKSNLPVVECDASSMSFEIFVETVRRAAEVHTDRLHCMILAALLGKKVFAYQTSYGKLEEVYSHSMKDWSDVTFVV
jgi:exopolysaccharide biosynthesis predicted pyruvyltransferase EpsI